MQDIKIKIEIIVPADSCSCSYSKWMEKVWDILENYREKIITETLDTNSSRAKEYGIKSQTVLVNGEKTNLFHLEEILKRI